MANRYADSGQDWWAANDPQKNIYDDTGWTFGELGNVQVARVTDIKVLDAPMGLIQGPVHAPGGVEGTGTTFLINHNADNGLMTLRYQFPNATFDSAEEPFEAAGHKFNRGSFIVRKVGSADPSRTRFPRCGTAQAAGWVMWSADRGAGRDLRAGADSPSPQRGYGRSEV